MAKTESQRTADSNYRKNNTKRITLRFFPKDMDVYEYAVSQESTQQYIRDLIRADMASNNEEA